MNTIIILLVALISSSIGILYAYWSLKVGEVDRTIAISNEPKFEINNDFYEENSHYWWGGDKPFESLQRLNDARFPEFERIIKETLIQKQPPSEKKRLLRILDVGCGGGYLSESLSRMRLGNVDVEVVGIDISSSTINQATEHASLFIDLMLKGIDNISYQVGSITNLSSFLKEESFDVVVAADVLEHIHNLPLAIQEIGKMLKSSSEQHESGLFLFDTINRTPLSRLLAIFFAQEVGLVRGMFDHCHNWFLFITPLELSSLLSSHGSIDSNMVEYKGLVPNFSFTSITSYLSSILKHGYFSPQIQISPPSNSSSSFMNLHLQTQIGYIGHGIKKSPKN